MFKRRFAHPGGVLPDDSPRDVAFWPILSKKEFVGISKQRWFKSGSQCAILIQIFNWLDSFVSNSNSTFLLRRLFRQYRPEAAENDVRSNVRY
jgi:hypothetical protein